MAKKLTLKYRQIGDWFKVYCPEIDVYGGGPSSSEAFQSVCKNILSKSADRVAQGTETHYERLVLSNDDDPYEWFTSAQLEKIKDPPVPRGGGQSKSPRHSVR